MVDVFRGRTAQDGKQEYEINVLRRISDDHEKRIRELERLLEAASRKP